MYPLSGRAVAEFIGTFALVFVGVGSILSDRVAGGDVTLVGIALAHGLTIAAMVSAFGHVSGAHLNPAVTLAAFIGKKISAGDAFAYVTAQLAGAIAGAFFLTMVFDPATRDAANLGTPGLASGVTIAQGLVFEAVATFLLVIVVFATAVDPRGAFTVVSGIPIGLVVTFDVLAGGPLTGAAMNPARAFGPALVAGLWTSHWVYWVGPMVGGTLAALLYTSLYLRRPNVA
jgi:MIP family channel proteins